MTSLGKLVTITLVSKPPPLTQIVRTGLGTRLDTLLLAAGPSCRSVSKSLRMPGEALRDDTKNGCVADY